MLEFRESDFSNLLNTFNEGVCYLNAQGELLYYNDAARIHWQIKPSSSYELALHPTIARALMGEQLRHEVVQVHDQSLLVNTRSVFNENENLVGVIVVTENISEHVALERGAEAALEVLLEAILTTFDIEDVENIDESLVRLAALIPRLEAVDNSIALRVDTATGRLIPLALFGSSQRSEEEWRKELEAIKLSTEHLMQKPGPAFLQAIRLARPLEINFTVDTSHSNPHNLRAAIYVPVFLEGRVVGLLGAERHRPLEYTSAYFPPWSVALLAALARVASMTLEKNRLLITVERLRADKERIQELIKQKDEFLLIVAHELKNPLTTILGMAQIMRRRLDRLVHPPPGSFQEMHDLIRGLASIEQQARRSTHIINMLVEMNRIDLERLDLALEDTDLLGLARRVLREYRILAPEREFRLFVNGEQVPVAESDDVTKAPIIVKGDEQRLELAFINLIGNAVKYSPEGTPVTVSIQDRDDQVELSVEDQGIGVPPAEQSRVIERFYRAENAQHTRGLGVGLYLVHTVATMHGGSLSIKSEGVPGKGSVFSITLPKQ